ncbi:MAG TPA: hypothetical protein VGD60_01725 [Candidatus Acidoferrales bacterium]
MKGTCHFFAARAIVVLFLVALSPAFAAAKAQQAPQEASVPRLVQFNGTLKDAAARPLTGAASVTFAIYAEQDGGTALWSETQNVIADASGHYNALLGGATPTGLPAELFTAGAGNGPSRWLGVTIARQPEMPRVLLASVPYALKAGDADTLGGLPASAYVTTQSLATLKPSTTILAPGSTATAPTPQISASSNEATPATSPISNAAQPVTGAGVADYIPLWSSSSTQGNSILFQTGGLIGIGTTTPAETLDVNGNSIFRGSFQLPPGHPAIASSGYESHSFQFQASSFNSGTGTSDTEAFGFRAEPLNNNTTNPSAKLDLFFGPGGSAPFTDTGFSFSSTGLVTFAPGQSFNGATETLTGALNLPQATSPSEGVINVGGASYLGNYGGPTNIFVGYFAGASGEMTTAAMYNTGVGQESLYGNSTGQDNSAFGSFSLYSNTAGGSNVGVGQTALFVNTVGSGNTAVGRLAGANMIDGTFNTFIGYVSEQNVSTNYTNATAIGAYSEVDASNALVLGSVAGVNTASVSVNVGIGTTSPQHTLEVIDNGASNAAIAGLSNVVGNNGILGKNTATSGDSNGGTFVTASATGSAVVGNNTAGGKAGYFVGDVQVTGMLTKGGGSFKIDDPIAPSEKYLSHSFVESPDMKNIYDGIVVTDAHGAATIQMPPWFDALNRDFRYQLTPVGRFAQAMVASEIKNGKFTIRTSKPHVKISWQVTGIRHDAWANAHRIPTEEEKPANEQGTYLHPELFGAPPDKEISSAPVAAAPRPASNSSAVTVAAGAGVPNSNAGGSR